MSGGGKGGSATSKVQIPDWLESAAQKSIGDAQNVQKIGYTPWAGPEVAAFSPLQQASMANTSQAANAFGLPAGSGKSQYMPQPTTYAGGVQGYGSIGGYEQALDYLKKTNPQQFNALNGGYLGGRR